MLRDDGPVKQEQDHFILAIRTQQAFQAEFEGLREWMQQELLSVISRSDILESTAMAREVATRMRAIHERAREIDLKELPEASKSIEQTVGAIKNRQYRTILEVSSLLERDIIPLRNLASELYLMRETLNLLQIDLIDTEDDDEC